VKILSVALWSQFRVQGSSGGSLGRSRQVSSVTLAPHSGYYVTGSASRRRAPRLIAATTTEHLRVVGQPPQAD
jgi:hypothetical protein